MTDIESSPLRCYDTAYFERYLKSLPGEEPSIMWGKFEQLDDRPPLTFSFEASAVYSANIEGNSIDLNYFINSKLDPQLVKFKQKEIDEIEALVNAYKFAQSNKLNEENLLKVHSIATKSILPQPARGRYRTTQVYILRQGGIEYAAIEPQFVAAKIQELMSDIKMLLSSSLSLNHIFYHSSLIHLVYAHIHPFSDGNGRTARLIEKWFLAELLGDNAWYIPSEQYYKQHQAEYYRNIKLGPNYYLLNYDKCVPFLTMLAKSMKN